MRPLVEQYGGGEVMQAGLDALGYPPAWVHTFKEASLVQTELLNQEKEKE